MSDRLPYGEGIFRRQFRLAAEPGRVVGDLEDDFHRVRVELEHDGERVVACRGSAPRVPWTTCPQAAAVLAELRGLPLARSLLASRRHTDPRAHCTHLFDLATLAVSLAAAGRSARAYAIAVPDRRDERTRPTLRCDGEPLLEWDVRDGAIAGPEPFAGRALMGGRLAVWADRELDPDTAEATLILQRACVIAMGRSFDLDSAPAGDVFGDRTLGACYSFSPERIASARRNLGTTREFTHAADRLLRE